MKIEINDISMEVSSEMAEARPVCKIGDAVKVNGDVGVIVALDNSGDAPTISIAVLKLVYGEAEVKMFEYSDDTDDTDGLIVKPLSEEESRAVQVDIRAKISELITRKQGEIDRMRKALDWANSEIFKETITAPSLSKSLWNACHP